MDFAGGPLIGRILEIARRAGDEPFLRLLGADGIATELSYGVLLQQAGVWSKIYRKHNLEPGQRVAIFLPHSVDSYAAFLGALLSALVPAMLPPPSPKLSTGRFNATVLPVLPITKSHAVVLGADFRAGFEAQPGLTVLDASATLSETVPTLDQVTFPIGGLGNTPAFLQYSSGTTGLRKAVAISQHACVRQVDLYRAAIELSPSDSIVSWLPLYHDMGLIACWMLPLLTGTPVTTMSPFDWVGRPSMLTRAIEDYRPTLCWLPNFAFSHLARSITGRDLTLGSWSSLRAVINCSEPIRHVSHEAFLRRFKSAGVTPAKIATCYAMAEATFAVTSSRVGEPPPTLSVDPTSLGVGSTVRPGERRLVSSGRPIGGTTVRIVDDRGNDVPDSVVGHVRVTSESLAAGYLENDEATQAAFAGNELHTGDLGFVSGGETFVLGRADDMIIVAGRNIYPQDLECVAESIPGTIPGRSVAFGVDDAVDGTAHIIVVVEVEEARNRDVLERQIASELVAQVDVSPRVVKIVDRGWLIKSTSGKVSRRLNRDRYLSEATTPPQASELTRPDKHAPLRSFVRAAVSAALGRSAPADDESLIMSGLLDSLSLTTLLLELGERIGDRLPMPNVVGFRHYETIESICRLLDEVERGFSLPAREALSRVRETKVKGLSRSTGALDLIILGSSTFLAVPSRMTKASAMSGFNLSVNRATLAELYCLLQLARNRRKAIHRAIVGLDLCAFRARSAVLDLKTLTLPEVAAYLAPEDQAEIAQRKREALLASQHSRINLERLAEWTPEVATNIDEQTGELIFATPNGHRSVRRHGPEEMTHEMVMAYAEFDALCPRQVTYLQRLVSIAATAGIMLDLVVVPINPNLHSFLAQSTRYFQRRTDVLAKLEPLRSETVRVHDMMTPSAFGGANDGFTDAHHFGPEIATPLLEHILSA